MIKRLLLGFTLLSPLAAEAVDLANGEQLNRNCALCHGIYGQGTPGRLSPRLAGLPARYIVKAVKEYKEGVRINPTMVETAGLATMSDSDIEDVSAYLASLDIGKYERFNVVHRLPGSADKGEEIFKDDCKTCHGKAGEGKEKKKAPPLAGQHGEYIFQSMRMFQSKVRNHDNDPEDEMFDDLDNGDLMNLIAFISTLDDDKIVKGEAFVPPRVVVAAAARAPVKRKTTGSGLQISNITQTVARMELKPGVSHQDAAEAMRSKAVELNLKLVGQQEVSKELAARGVESPHLSIYQFCDPMDARTMIISNPIFSSYMPCRISMVEDQQGKTWLMMLNLDMLIDSQLLPQDIVTTAIRVNQQMLDVMVAGATGEF